MLNAPLSKLGLKEETPIQYTNPIKWINDRIRKSTGEKFSVTEKDLRPYLIKAHKYDIGDFNPETPAGKEMGLSQEAYEAICEWKSVIENKKYSCNDVILLANKLKDYAKSYRESLELFREKLGESITQILRPFAFNTSASAGFSLSVAAFYESRLEIDGAGKVVLKKWLQYSQSNYVYAYIHVSKNIYRIVSAAEIDAIIHMDGAVVQNHGIVDPSTPTLIACPVYSSAKDNQFSRLAQLGSQTMVYKPLARRVKELDLNSSFPAAMAFGCQNRVRFDGYKSVVTIDGVEQVIEVPGSPAPISCNALLGYEEPGSRTDKPTSAMYRLGLATLEAMKNEKGEDSWFWVVRGRNRILHMLQFRNGEFMTLLVPSTNRDLLENPLISFRTRGTGLDSRLINPAITEPALAMLRGSTLATYAAEPTIDDDSMVVFLAETDKTGTSVIRSMSRHGQIMGVGVSKSGKIFGKPELPHVKYFSASYSKRSHIKKKAKEAKRNKNFRFHDMLLAEAEMIKLLMNAGGYGTYAQNSKQERIFSLENVDECSSIINTIIPIDPEWSGMDESVSRLRGESVEGAGWMDLAQEIEQYRLRIATLESDLSSSDMELSKKAANLLREERQIFTVAMRTLFATWADNHICTFDEFTYQKEGSEHKERMAILVAGEETASHAIRSYAAEVVAKANINLWLGQCAVRRSPFQLAYSDTDSLHVDTSVIKPITDERMQRLVEDLFGKHIGGSMPGYEKALDMLMESEHADDAFIAVIKSCGLSVGADLGQWGLEKTGYQKGFEPSNPLLEIEQYLKPYEPENQVNREYRSDTTYYLAPKVYIDTDKNGVVARAKVRSVPKINPLQPAVFKGFVVGIPALSDRRGLTHEHLRYVDLSKPVYATAKNEQGKSEKVLVNALFANPRRKYRDESGSEPFKIAYTEDLKHKILAGQTFSANYLATAALHDFGLGVNKENIRGLEIAYNKYVENATIIVAEPDEDKKLSRLKRYTFNSLASEIHKSYTKTQSLINDVIDDDEDSQSEVRFSITREISGGENSYIPDDELPF